MEFHIFTLKNGIRVIHKEDTSTNVSHCGLIIDVGSRDENDDEQGLAHYIEHCIFKGTKNRKAFHILSRLDAVGGELNAYTTKEETCIYASFVKEYYERAIELIADIVFNSIFPIKEIAKEKDVIIDEIDSYLDSPSEQIYDDFEELIFGKHPLGRNILGTKESVPALTQEHVLKFIKRNYATNKMVFTSIGNIKVDKLKLILEKHFLEKSTTSFTKRKLFKNYKSNQIIIKKPIFQSHCILGNIAYSNIDKKKLHLILLNNLLGGPAMNTRLNLNIREKYGYTYNLESSYNTFSDTGVFQIYMGTDPKYLEKTMNLVSKELDKLRLEKLGTRQLKEAKQQLIGFIALAEENKNNKMLSIGKTLLVYNKIETLEDIYRKINAITAEQLLDVANEIFEPTKLSSLIYMAENK